MKKQKKGPLSRLYHYLGGVGFAIVLIALLAISVTAGTFVEGATDSHMNAAEWIYSHPLFGVLLSLFFINILFAATRRWPWKPRHIPFLITHLGLLMILTGTIAKAFWGVQGNMAVLEGGESQSILTRGSQAIWVEKRQDGSSEGPGDQEKEQFEIQYSLLGTPQKELLPVGKNLEDLSLELVDLQDHCSARYQFWIHGAQAKVRGLPAFPLHNLSHGQKWSPGHPVRFYPFEKHSWEIFAAKDFELEQRIQELLKQKLYIQVGEEAPVLLEQALSQALPYDRGVCFTSLICDLDPIQEELKVELQFTLTEGQRTEHLSLPLAGDLFGQFRSLEFPFLSPNLAPISLRASPSILFLQEYEGLEHAFALNEDGKVYFETFRSENIQKFVVFDKGYEGYGVNLELPYGPFPAGLDFHRARQKQEAFWQLCQVLDEAETLPLYLQVFKAAARETGQDWQASLFLFLETWAQGRSWFFPKDRPLPQALNDLFSSLSLEAFHPSEVHAARWATVFFDRLLEALGQGSELFSILSEQRWPLLHELQAIAEDSEKSKVEELGLLLQQLTQQMLLLAHYLPPEQNMENSAGEKALIFSVLLRSQGIHLENLASYSASPEEVRKFYLSQSFVAEAKKYQSEREGEELSQALTGAYLQWRFSLGLNPPEEIDDQEIHETLRRLDPPGERVFHISEVLNQLPQRLTAPPFELQSHLSQSFSILPPMDKLEDNVALVQVRLKDPSGEESIALPFDPHAVSLKWPVLDGRYLLRFQAKQENLPHRLRLRDARQINYPTSFQAYAYESDVIIDDKECTISMNNVHESWDGYRFYMASLTPPDESRARQVQIVVNHDPLKYRLTYPGGMVLSLGILLLFWQGSFRKRRNQRISK